ncbi:hypothetical protein GKZ90_0007055 [Flavobacterium sp. MC2016-06]|uniref:hypothetical protein n=1 Tax=Flavobacterium sp. MC2016-06 TaxID=2676308 RepID=UPI0012BA58A3|nr:hypothetical protein [Flavobacterium sp. MC2016-06]MBU3857899.1 hypothetical protein [Flavobacterium sp. MC2016-06]
MKIQIEEGKNHSLYAYKDDELLFYSTIKFYWNKRIIKIFDKNNELILEVKSKMIFCEAKYSFLFQNEDLAKNIMKINCDEIHFGENQYLNRKKDDFFSLNLNGSYFLKEIKIGEIKQKWWRSKKKILLDLGNNENLKFLEYIIVHILVVNTDDD